MAREADTTRLKRWFSRINAADRAYSRWHDNFKVARSKRYWKGVQRVGDDRLDDRGNERVQVNLIGPTVGIKIPSLYFYYPYARINGSPSIADTPGQTIEERALLLQDTANTIIRDHSTGFRRETLMALKEAMWSFGCIEVGYSAEFVDNPSFQRPPLAEDKEVKTEGMDKGVAAPPPPMREEDDLSALEHLISEENFYCRRIPSEQVRVSVSGRPNLLDNDWVGYYEWIYVEDLKRSKAYRNTSSLKSGGKLAKDFRSPDDDNMPAVLRDRGNSDVDDDSVPNPDRDGQVKVWKVWDLRTKTKLVMAEGHDKYLLRESFKRCPLHFLSFEDDPDDFYPIPPIYAMLGPQDEYNDSREMLRQLRKSIYPRYVAEQSIEDSELRKLEDGGSGVTIKVGQATPVPIQPIAQPTHDSNIIRTLSISKEDFFQVSGVGGEARGQAEAETATQASIMNQRSLVRDSYGRLRVAEWLGSIIRGLLYLAIDHMTLPMWVMRNSDPYSPAFLQDAAKISHLHRQITMEDLQDAERLLRWDVSVDVETLSPLTEDSMRMEWQQALGLISQPAVAMLLSQSPELLKITLERFGIRSSRDQAAIGQALGVMAQQAAQAEGGMGGVASPAAPGGGGGISGPGGGPGASPGADMGGQQMMDPGEMYA